LDGFISAGRTHGTAIPTATIRIRDRLWPRQSKALIGHIHEIYRSAAPKRGHAARAIRELFRDDTTGYTITSIPRRITLQVVGLSVNHQGRSAVAERGVAVRAQIHAFVHDHQIRFPLGIHGEIVHVTGVGTVGILEAVLLAVGVEMGASRFEIRRFALGILVDVNGVFAGWQVLQVQLDLDAFTSGLERRCPYTFAFGVLKNDAILLARHQPRGTGRGEKKDSRDSSDFHNSPIIAPTSGTAQDRQNRLGTEPSVPFTILSSFK
jgi:hypothetical protein